MTSTDLTFPIAFTSLLLLLSVLTLQLLKTKLGLNHPNKKYHPIAGTIFNQLLNLKRLHHYMTALSAKYKTYRLIGVFRNEVFTADPANVEYILKTNFANYGKGELNHGILSDLLGDGIFAVDGDKWKQQRKINGYELSTNVLRNFSTDVFRKNAAKLASVVFENAKSDRSMDIQDLFMKSALDSIFKIAFGVELDCLCGSYEGNKFRIAFDKSSVFILRRFADASWKIKRFLNIGTEAALKKNLQLIDKFVYKIIDDKIEQMRSAKDESEIGMKRDDVLSRILQTNDLDGKYVRDIILNFVTAGKDTTGSAFSWFIYVLCAHPDVQEKAAEEIRVAIKTNRITEFTEVASNVTEEALQKMNYLHAAITESLRLFPAVPAAAKVCFSDDTLPDGFSVREGDMVIYLPYAMGRMRYIWGDDAEEYRPERWLNGDGIFQPENPFKFTAFQAGPRICMGKEFAYRQMKIYAAVLLSCFNFRLSNKKEQVNYKTMINLHIDGGLHVHAFCR